MKEETMLKITINDETFQVKDGLTIMEAISEFGETTPIICYHDATTAEGLCRLCVVEVEGWRVLAPACITKVSEGMVIKTKSERVQRSRKTILEMLNASVDLSQALDIQKQITEYGAEQNRFPMAIERSYEVLDDNPFYVRDYNKCILCWRCVQACGNDLQFTYALSVGGRGHESKISTFFDSPMTDTTCVYCGNCVAVCPTNALQGKTEFFIDQGLDYDQIRIEKRNAKRKISNK